MSEKNDRECTVQVSHTLEALLPGIREMVNRFRDGTEASPYACLYTLRREIGYLTQHLAGYKAPTLNECDAVCRMYFSYQGPDDGSQTWGPNNIKRGLRS